MNIELYPPVLHQASILSEEGEVTVLDTVTSSQDVGQTHTAESIKRVRVIKEEGVTKAIPFVSRAAWLRRYIKEFKRQLANHPDVVIAYEPEAASLLLTAKRSTHRFMRIVHLHELPEKETCYSLNSRMALRLMMRRLAKADLVVVPDYYRGAFVQEAANLPVRPLVVMNCPRLLPQLPESLLLPLLREQGVMTNKIVHYQGAVGASHGLENTIRSMSFWPTDAVFTIVGGVGEQYLASLKRLAAEMNVSQRVIFVGRVPYNEVFKYAVGATVGISFLDVSYQQFATAAGASNKRFEYAALGMSQVTTDSPGIEALFVRTGIAATTKYDDVAEIGAAINRYLENRELSRSTGEKARRLHLSKYNYEYQIQPLLNSIKEWADHR